MTTTFKLTSPRNLLSFIALMAALPAACGGQDAGDDTSCGDTCASAYAERGLHTVGTERQAHGELAFRAWYPTDSESEESNTYEVALQLPGFPSEPLPILGHASESGRVHATEDGLPIVILSHGFALNPEWYAPLAEHLASYGFFVLAPQHRESDWASDVVTATAARPHQVHASIDFAIEGPYARYVDGERVAVIGHSYGGYTALAAGGARINYEDLEERCESAEEAFVQGFLCPPFLEGKEALADAMGLGAPPSGLWPSMADSRVDAIIPIAGDAYAFGPEGLASLQVPMLALGGTADTGTPWSWGTALAYEGAGSADRRLVGLEGGEHFLPIADCLDMPWMANMPEEFRSYICDDPAWNKAEAHALIHHFVTAFLLETLLDDARAREALDPLHYLDAQDSVRYERTSP